MKKVTVGRKLELLFCDLLKEQISDHLFLASKGGDDTEEKPDQDAEEIESVPYTVIEAAQDGQRSFADEDTYLLTVTLATVVNAADLKPSGQSELLRRIHDAVGAIRRGVYASRGIVIHGVDISAPHRRIEADDGEHGNADVMWLSVGCSG
jgi:hypothetical protein